MMSSMLSAVFLWDIPLHEFHFCVKHMFLPIYFMKQDSNDNRVAQWLNKTADSSILQLSYSLNSEAKEGIYQVIVTVGQNKIYHNFKVEKYGK